MKNQTKRPSLKKINAMTLLLPVILTAGNLTHAQEQNNKTNSPYKPCTVLLNKFDTGTQYAYKFGFDLPGKKIGVGKNPRSQSPIDFRPTKKEEAIMAQKGYQFIFPSGDGKIPHFTEYDFSIDLTHEWQKWPYAHWVVVFSSRVITETWEKAFHRHEYRILDAIYAESGNKSFAKLLYELPFCIKMREIEQKRIDYLLR